MPGTVIAVLRNRWVPPFLPPLGADVESISAPSGGTVNLAIDFAPVLAGSPYVGLFGASGETPGLDVGRQRVFLNFDPLTFLPVQTSASPFLPGFAGTLSATGDASASLTVPPGLLQAVVGERITIVFGALGSEPVATNPARVRILP